MVTVINDCFEKQVIDLLFTVEYDSKLFAVYCDDNDGYECKEMKNKLTFDGIRLLDTEIDKEVSVCVDAIVNDAFEHPHKDKLNGENYKITKAKDYLATGILSFKRTGQKWFFTKKGQICVKLLNVVLLNLLSVAIFLLLSKGFTGLLGVNPEFSAWATPTRYWTLFAFAVLYVNVSYYVLCEIRDVICAFGFSILPYTAVCILLSTRIGSVVRITVIVVLCVVLMVSLITMYCKARKIVGNLIAKNFSTIFTLVFVSMCVVYSVTTFMPAKEDPIKDAPLTRPGYVATDVEENYKQALDMLDRDVWETKNVDERCKVLQAISDYECQNVLGCETIKVVVKDIKEEIIMGYYNRKERTICVDTAHVASSDVSEVINTILHEVRHVWQHGVAESYLQIEPHLTDEQKKLDIYVQACEFAENFKNYVSGTDNIDEYAVQSIEKDSRAWAEATYLVWYAEYVE